MSEEAQGLEARPRPEDSAAATTMGLRHPFHTPVFHGTVEIEYKPKRFVLDESTMAHNLDAYGLEVQPEEFVEDLYWRLVELLYPGEASYDEPWEYVPLVVRLEYQPVDLRGNAAHSATLGRMH